MLCPDKIEECKMRSNHLSTDVDYKFLPCCEGVILDLLLRDALEVATDVLVCVGDPHWRGRV